MLLVVDVICFPKARTILVEMGASIVATLGFSFYPVALYSLSIILVLLASSPCISIIFLSQSLPHIATKMWHHCLVSFS